MRAASPRGVAFAAVAAALLLTTPATAKAPTIQARTIQLLQWWLYYGDLIAPTVEPPFDPFPSPDPPPPPTIADRFRKASTPYDMVAEAQASFKTIKQTHPQLSTAMRKAGKLEIADCRASGVQVLTSVSSPDKPTICISSLLLQTLFVECAGTDLERLRYTIARMEIDPRSVSEDPHPGMRRAGVTREDWAAQLSLGERAWTCWRGSIDFVVARQLAASQDGPSPTQEVLNTQAKAALLAAGTTAKTAALKATLKRAVDRYQDPWGFSAPGDAGDVAAALD